MTRPVLATALILGAIAGTVLAAFPVVVTWAVMGGGR